MIKGPTVGNGEKEITGGRGEKKKEGDEDTRRGKHVQRGAMWG